MLEVRKTLIALAASYLLLSIVLLTFFVIEYQFLGYLRSPFDNSFSGFILLFGALNMLSGVFHILYLKNLVRTRLGLFAFPAGILLASIAWSILEMENSNNMNLGRVAFLAISGFLAIQSIMAGKK